MAHRQGSKLSWGKRKFGGQPSMATVYTVASGKTELSMGGTKEGNEYQGAGHDLLSPVLTKAPSQAPVSQSPTRNEPATSGNIEHRNYGCLETS